MTMLIDGLPVGEWLRCCRIADPYVRLRCMAREATMTARDLSDVEQGRALPTSDQFSTIVDVAARGCKCRFCGTAEQEQT